MPTVQQVFDLYLAFAPAAQRVLADLVLGHQHGDYRWWLSLGEVSHILKRSKGQVSRYVRAGSLRTNGKKHYRIHAASVVIFLIEKAKAMKRVSGQVVASNATDHLLEKASAILAKPPANVRVTGEITDESVLEKLRRLIGEAQRAISRDKAMAKSALLEKDPPGALIQTALSLWECCANVAPSI